LILIFIIFTAFSVNNGENITGKHSVPDNNLFLEAGKVRNVSGEGYIFTDNTILSRGPLTGRKIQVLGADMGQEGRNRIVSYKVRPGDSLESVADKFSISKDTIKWANSLTNGKINSEDELLILPTTGVLYYVQRGESLSDIALKHEADMEDIVAYNDNLKDLKDTIRPGDQLIIPDGKKPAAPIRRQAPPTTHSRFAAVTYGTVTQTAHPGHAKAVDIANACGTPIYAGGGGTVTRTGNSWPAGNYIRIDHGSFNGLYAHLQGIHVSPGQSVSAGQQIGTMGTTGLSTGCHLHFETSGGYNPFSGMQRGQTMGW